jgi:hypothetical protein
LISIERATMLITAARTLTILALQDFGLGLMNSGWISPNQNCRLNS